MIDIVIPNWVMAVFCIVLLAGGLVFAWYTDYQNNPAVAMMELIAIGAFLLMGAIVFVFGSVFCLWPSPLNFIIVSVGAP